jgi:hypothetical protein
MQLTVARAIHGNDKRSIYHREALYSLVLQGDLIRQSQKSRAHLDEHE